MESLKSGFGTDVAAGIAARLARAWPPFPVEAFLQRAGDGFHDLELTGRARHIAGALGECLPSPFPVAADVVEAALGPPQTEEEPDGGMASFVDLPYVYWVAEAGLEHPERALEFQRELTRRFTAEFSIRRYIEVHPELTMATLTRWTTDPDGQVRRLVSEGTRPRLPWAAQLTAFRRDPTPIIPLLEALRDDPSSYVRRSVANNLNDVSKDHPDLVLDVARRWMRDAGDRRRAVIRHALRTLLREANPAAFAILGAASTNEVRVDGLRIDPPAPLIGERVAVSWRLEHGSSTAIATIVHLRVHYVRPAGTSERVFTIGERTLEPHRPQTMRRSISLAQMSTRTHHPGVHRVEVLVNGVARAEGTFDLRA